MGIKYDTIRYHNIIITTNQLNPVKCIGVSIGIHTLNDYSGTVIHLSLMQILEIKIRLNACIIIIIKVKSV